MTAVKSAAAATSGRADFSRPRILLPINSGLSCLLMLGLPSAVGAA
jgi:hypothetical protein